MNPLIDRHLMPFHLTPLRITDQYRLERAMAGMATGRNTNLAAWSFPSHYIWKDIFTYSWAEVDGWWFLFAEYSDGIFMPLPPLGPQAASKSSCHTLQQVLQRVMDFMDTRNRGTRVTRIENIPAGLKEEMEAWGMKMTAKDPDYLYYTSHLVQLKGNAYKSQRAAYNRCIRTRRIRITPYRIFDRDACFALFHRWMSQKEDVLFPGSAPHEDVAYMMLRDAAKAHRVVLQEFRELGLIGRVVWVDGSLKAYTFGYPQSRNMFCVLLEVADRSVYGLAQYLFREFSREFQQYPLINTMDDSGLPRLARSKVAYHPCQLVSNYIAQPS